MRLYGRFQFIRDGISQGQKIYVLMPSPESIPKRVFEWSSLLKPQLVEYNKNQAVMIYDTGSVVVLEYRPPVAPTPRRREVDVLDETTLFDDVSYQRLMTYLSKGK